MADIKSNIRDGAYVALGACALGVSHLTKKREVIVDKFNAASSTVSSTVAPKASSLLSQLKKQSQTCIDASVKIAQEAKKRIK